ncbi:MAG: hypothetical protein AAGA91_07170 [Pseudomonadota bacterium]
MLRPRNAWLVLVMVWLGFFLWYTSLAGPLTESEIRSFIAQFEARGVDAADLDALREFLESDTGDDFVMANLIEMNNPPPPIEGVPEDANAQELLDVYMAHMYPALFKRASHPVLFGMAAAPAVDIWGIEGANQWTTVAMMRYRSRRDMLEIATNPAFQGPHEFKIAAMKKTIAFPADPWGYLGDPRLLLALVLVIVGLSNHLAWISRRSSPTT